MHPTSRPIIDFGRRARLATCATGIAAIVAGTANAGFVGFVVTKTQTSNSGVDLDVYGLFARFNGPTDTVLTAFGLYRPGFTGAQGGFYHKDTSSYNGGVLMKDYGTWAPQATGSPTLNRPFDSYLTIGGQAVGSNATGADPSWGAAFGWSRATLPSSPASGSWDPSDTSYYGPAFLTGLLASWGSAPGSPYDVFGGDGVVGSADAGISLGYWGLNVDGSGASTQFPPGVGIYNMSPPSLQGQVGVGANTSTDVRLGQFVVDRGADLGTWSLTVGYTSGVSGASAQFATSTFAIPSPGAIALLGVAGLNGGRRRRVG